MAKYFYLVSAIVFVVFIVLTILWPLCAVLLVPAVGLFIIGVIDLNQTKHGVRRNFPIVGNLRYLLELIRPELQQYFVESNLSGRPIPRELRSVVYQRAKGDIDTLPFGTQRNVYEEGHEWVEHSIAPTKVNENDLRVNVGGPACLQPYQAHILNISAMSYGALSPNAVRALNLGAREGRFYHNTGEGGISPYHLEGGDLVWQIGTAYFGCRTADGAFSDEAFKERAALPQVKMIEIKLSQGAKPGKGGLLPAAKVTEEIARIRLVEMGKDVVSPAGHSAFSTPEGLLHFVARLRDLSGGKPTGFKLCVGRKSEFVAICKAMLETKIYPDFITVDGAEGGTGAAPLEFSNSVGVPLEEGLSFVHDMLVGFGIRPHIRIICSGKVFTSLQMLTKLALGADMVNSARGMMLALGCIQALKCNTNHCPVGVATTDQHLARGLHVPDKYERVASFHTATVHAFADMLGAMGYESPARLQRSDVFRRQGDGRITSYEDLFPSIAEGSLLNSARLPDLRKDYRDAIAHASPETFQPSGVQVREPIGLLPV
ncbi:MAG: FMN-binding glutamate synthase family protein [Chloroflexota bacterium]